MAERVTKRPRSFRFEPTDLERWQKRADADGLNLTEWITRQTNAAMFTTAMNVLFSQSEREQGHGVDRGEDLRGDETVHEDSGRIVDLVRRTTSDPLPTPVRSPRTATEATLRHDRRARSRTSGTLRQIEDVTHSTARKHGVGTDARDSEAPRSDTGPDSGNALRPSEPVESVELTAEDQEELQKTVERCYAEDDAERRQRAPRPGPLNEPTSTACVHGVAKGYHCWQCGGIAKVAELETSKSGGIAKPKRAKPAAPKPVRRRKR
jgi:hypothetical protein